MANNPHGIAQSRYRQIRVTITHETNGRFSWAMYAKGLNDAWHEHQCLLRGSDEGIKAPLLTTEDALTAFLVVCEHHLL